MKILFKTNFSTQHIELDLNPQDSGLDVRKILAEKLEVSLDELKINYWGDVLEDTVILSKYDMKDGDTIGYDVHRKPLRQVKGANQGGKEQEISPAITLKLKTKDIIQEVEVFPEDTIAVARFKISQKFNYPLEAIMLRYQQFPLFPVRRIIDCGIKEGSELDMTLDEKMIEIA